VNINVLLLQIGKTFRFFAQATRYIYKELWIGARGAITMFENERIWNGVDEQEETRDKAHMHMLPVHIPSFPSSLMLGVFPMVSLTRVRPS